MQTDLTVIFGHHLRQARKKAQLTQEELAFRTGLDRTYVSLLELGRKCPTLAVLFRLCEVIAIAPDALVASVYEELRMRGNGISSSPFIP
jgi:transcriptional regulator with XRE-family HTH domain